MTPASDAGSDLPHGQTGGAQADGLVTPRGRGLCASRRLWATMEAAMAMAMIGVRRV
jgi:hypothetical protein